jgi:fructoselysine-6-phosphate deglycase
MDSALLKFDEQKTLDNINGALALRPQIEGIVDRICRSGYDAIFFLGIGGTYASSLQVENYVTQRGTMLVFAENAAAYITRGNPRITSASVVVISSVTGNTDEVVTAVKTLKKQGTQVFGFINEPDSPLAASVDYLVTFAGQEQIKFLLTANRFLYNKGDFADYDDFNRNMEENLAAALVETEKQADDFGKKFAEDHHDDALHYFTGSGIQWGGIYSYAMCFWEEMHWLRTKSIHAGEFFHGTLEVIDRDTPVTVFLGEDKERPLAERAAAFIPRVSARSTIIDTRDYPLPGIAPEYRWLISHLAMRAVTSRIDAYTERLNRHPMEIRRYYRKLTY